MIDVTKDLQRARKTQAFQLLKLLILNESLSLIHSGKLECLDGSELEFFESSDAAILVPPSIGDEPT